VGSMYSSFKKGALVVVIVLHLPGEWT